MELMIDFETLGQKASTVVISIGAQFFCLETFTLGPTFYMAFEIDQQLKDGRTITADTLKWWMSQSGAAKKVFNEKAKPIKEVMTLFTQWVQANHSISKVKPWGNGASFDISIIENIFDQYDVKCPWIFYNVMDMRTFKRFVANNAKVDKSGGVAHNALDDARMQSEFVLEHEQFRQQMIETFKSLAQPVIPHT